MKETAISVENLSKLYRIGQLHERHDTLRDTLSGSLQRLRRRPERKAGRADETFWALKDVSFEVKRGEVVGIIGRNGAGKSTLLKILSRITEPTSGRAEIHGRVGSLLEVGTGFHPELTGRENIYLSGAMLGMRRHEIDRRFEEIVDFSGVAKFIDTPIKRYSSGMNVRLGFAVAAYLEPEVLLIDEVLAVGDVEFQRKCLGKMGEVAGQGRTVLFVSHNMASIAQFCTRCVLVEQGRGQFDGLPEQAISQYLGSGQVIRGAIYDLDNSGLEGTEVSAIAVSCKPQTLFVGSSLLIVIDYSVESTLTGLRFGVSIETTMGQRVSASYTGREGLSTGPVMGKQRATIHFPILNLVPGDYFVSVAIHAESNENLVRIERATSFRMLAADLSDSGNLVDERNGLIWIDHEWNLNEN